MAKLIAALFVVILAGCGTAGTSASGPGTTPETSASADGGTPSPSGESQEPTVSPVESERLGGRIPNGIPHSQRLRPGVRSKARRPSVRPLSMIRPRRRCWRACLHSCGMVSTRTGTTNCSKSTSPAYPGTPLTSTRTTSRSVSISRSRSRVDPPRVKVPGAGRRHPRGIRCGPRGPRHPGRHRRVARTGGQRG